MSEVDKEQDTVHKGIAQSDERIKAAPLQGVNNILQNTCEH